MTSREIDWSKLDEMIEKSKEVISDFNRLKEIREIIRNLYKQKDVLDNEESKIRDKYKQSYTEDLNDRLDEYGILTIITSNNHDEGRLLSVTEDEMKVRYTYNYGSRSDEITISTQELKEKGFVKVDWVNGPMFIVDKIKDPLDVFEIIKFRLAGQVKEQMGALKRSKEQMAEYAKKIKKAEEELEKYKKVSDTMITRIFNEISFGVTDLPIEDILKALPREICMYKEVNE